MTLQCQGRLGAQCWIFPPSKLYLCIYFRERAHACQREGGEGEAEAENLKPTVLSATSTLGHLLRALLRELQAPWQASGSLSVIVRAKLQNIAFAC